MNLALECDWLRVCIYLCFQHVMRQLAVKMVVRDFALRLYDLTHNAHDNWRSKQVCR